MTVLGREVLGMPLWWRWQLLDYLEERSALPEELRHHKRPPLGWYVAPDGHH